MCTDMVRSVAFLIGFPALTPFSKQILLLLLVQRSQMGAGSLGVPVGQAAVPAPWQAN
jgi:hypothetical protein